MVRNFSRIAVFIALFCCFGKTYAAEPPQFIFPVACTLGKDCWSVDYVDMDPAEGAVKDFKCGHKSKDGHKGTDFAIRSLAEMRAGVDVFAAKDGTVLRLRDGESDSLKTQAELDAIKAQNKDCGNGVLIDHGNGLRTMYCHLKKDSIIVKPKDKIKAGNKIAQVGQSGMAEFPHLHFGVIWEDGVIDPYTGLTNTDGCGEHKQSLWAEGLPMAYEPIAIYDGGFRVSAPDFTAIKNGEKNPEKLGTDIPAFVFWAALYGMKKDDRVNITIQDPLGGVFAERAVVQEKNRARQYYYAGRKLTRRTLEPGVYKGVIRVNRTGLPERKKEFTVSVE